MRGEDNTETVGEKERLVGWMPDSRAVRGSETEVSKGAGTAGGHCQEVVNLGLEPERSGS